MTKTTNTSDDDSPETLSFRLTGQVGDGGFPAWMEKHARKLGVEFTITRTSSRHITLDAIGKAEMLEAFALGCSLGPRYVQVEMLEVIGTSLDLQSDRFFSAPSNFIPPEVESAD